MLLEHVCTQLDMHEEYPLSVVGKGPERELN